MATGILGMSVSASGRLLIGLAPATALWMAILGQFIGGLGFAAYNTGTRATQQAVVAPEMQGRFFAVRFSVFTALTPISLAIAGPVADAVGVRLFWFLWPAAGLLIAAIWRLVPAVYDIEAEARRRKSSVDQSV
jgi:DHA3 family macrolide efflux protein-like MFS transporter